MISWARGIEADDAADASAVKRPKARVTSMPARWRELAAQARRAGALGGGQGVKQRFLELAEGYEKLAKGIEEDGSSGG